jgi:hypothetical protein
VQFGLQFEEIAEGQSGQKQDTQKPEGKKSLSAVSAPDRSVKSANKKSETSAQLPMVPPAPASAPAVTPPPPAATPETTEPGPDKPSGGGEVVRLDRFRKK